MPEDTNSSQVFNYNTEFVNSNCIAFFTSLQRTSALSFTEPSPHPSPSPYVDLCTICALVQIFYIVSSSSLLSTERQPVCRKEDCSPFDIGTVYKVIASVTDTGKFRFIESFWKPDLLFEFPTVISCLRAV